MQKNKNALLVTDLTSLLNLLREYVVGLNMITLVTPLVACALANKHVSLHACPNPDSTLTLRECIQ